MSRKGRRDPKIHPLLDRSVSRGDKVLGRIVEPSGVNYDIVSRPYTIVRRRALRWARDVKG